MSKVVDLTMEIVGETSLKEYNNKRSAIKLFSDTTVANGINNKSFGHTCNYLGILPENIPRKAFFIRQFFYQSLHADCLQNKLFSKNIAFKLDYFQNRLVSK